MSIRFAVAAFLLFAAPAAGAYDFSSQAIGTTGAEFLTLDTGARAIAMGGAYTAVTNDAYSMYWNPAGLAQIPKISATFMHNAYVAGINLDYLSYAQRIDDAGVLAGALRYMDAGSIPSLDVNAIDQGSFHPRNYSYELGYGQYLSDFSGTDHDFAIGAVGKVVQSDLVKRATTGALDVGVQTADWDLAYPVRAGFAAQNIGPGLKHDAVRDTLPFRARFGAAADVTRSLLATMELILPSGNQPQGAIGAEWAVETRSQMKAFFRGGLDTSAFTGGITGFRGLNLGFGIAGRELALDYAFVPMGYLGTTHRVSITLNIAGKSKARHYRRR